MSFLKYSVQTFSVRVFLVVLSMVAGAINARWLGPVGLGIFVILSTLPSLAFRFGNLGFGSAFAFYVAKKKISAKKVFVMSWIMGLAMGAIVCLVLLAVRQNRFMPWNDISPVLFYMMLVSSPVLFVNNFLRRTLSGQLEITSVNLSNFIRTVILLVFTVYYVVICDFGIMGTVMAFVVSCIATSFFLTIEFLRVQKRHADDDKDVTNNATVVDIWRFGRWSYLLMMTNIVMEDLPLFFLKYLGSDVIVGFFSIARGLSRRPRLAVTSFSKMLFPFTAASKDREASRRTNILCRNCLPLMLVCSVVLVFLAKPLIVLIYGSDYAYCATIFYALVPTIIFYPVSQFLGVHVSASGNPKITFLTSLPGLVVAIFLCYALIPHYQAIGAALVVGGVYATLTSVRIYVYMRQTKTRLRDILIMKHSDILIYKTLFSKIIETVRRSLRKRNKPVIEEGVGL